MFLKLTETFGTRDVTVLNNKVCYLLTAFEGCRGIFHFTKLRKMIYAALHLPGSAGTLLFLYGLSADSGPNDKVPQQSCHKPIPCLILLASIVLM
jgi:hypothetical protein